MMHSYPLDRVVSNGSLFWSGTVLLLAFYHPFLSSITSLHAFLYSTVPVLHHFELTLFTSLFFSFLLDVGAKKPPSPLIMDSSDALHLEFITAVRTHMHAHREKTRFASGSVSTCNFHLSFIFSHAHTHTYQQLQSRPRRQA